MQEQSSGAGRPAYLTGTGSDDHRIERNDGGSKPVKLAGVVVSEEYTPVAHSDGDVAYHAIANALLLAIGERDIGFHFPDTDPGYEGIEGDRLLGSVMERVRKAGYRVNNATIMITAGRPRLGPHIDAMRDNAARALGVEAGSVGIGATTGEGLSEQGKGNGINAIASVSLRLADGD